MTKDTFQILPVDKKFFQDSDATPQDITFRSTVDEIDDEVTVKMYKRNIGRRYQIGDDMSVFELPNGSKVYVALSLEDLDNRLSGAEQTIDLTDVTGSELSRAADTASISDLFNVSCMKQKIGFKDLLIVMYGSALMEGANTAICAFLEGEIDSIHDKDDKPFAELKCWTQYKDEWGMNDLVYGPYIHGHMPTLKKLISEAKRSGKSVLDLRGYTQTTSDRKLGPKHVKVSKNTRWLKKYIKS